MSKTTWFIVGMAVAMTIMAIVDAVKSSDDKGQHIATTTINVTTLEDTGLIKPFIPTQNITIKYLDDGSGNPGLVVKWVGGAILADNESWQPVEWIQRFEPWLNERCDTKYRVTWEDEGRTR